jgi:hypothetical protein
MKSRARYTRIFVCALLLLSSLLVLSLQEIPADNAGGGGYDPPPTSATSSLVATTLTTTVTNATTTTATITTTTTSATTRWNTTTSTTSLTVPLIDGYVVSPETILAIFLGFIIIVLALLSSSLILRSRSSRALDELNGQRRLVHELRTQQPGPATGLSASSALKRLLELGVLQPKEYMEKKMLAERIEKKTSAKQLLDEGLISKEQYDVLTRKQE